MKFVADVRRAMQVRTIFNLLGPLVNPASPAYQLLGVPDLNQMRLYTNVLKRLGMRFAIVTSLDGYDEISLTGGFKIVTSSYEEVLRPQQVGLQTVRQEELHGGDTPQKAAAIFDSVLENRSTRSQKECVVINAAFAIQAIEPLLSIEECIATARASIESGAAAACFRRFVSHNS